MRSAPRPRSVISTLRARCHFYLAPTPDGSRVRRESHARFCERLAVKLRRPTHPLYCTRNLKGNFRIGMRTEKSRLRRSLMSLQDLLRRIRHLSVREQVNTLNAALRGHYAYYGIAGNFRSLQKLHRAADGGAAGDGRPYRDLSRYRRPPQEQRSFWAPDARLSVYCRSCLGWGAQLKPPSVAKLPALPMHPRHSSAVPFCGWRGFRFPQRGQPSDSFGSALG